MTDEEAINTKVRAAITLNYPHLTEHIDHIIQAGWSLAASRGWYGCEWYAVILAMEGEERMKKLTGVNNMDQYRKDVESHCGRILTEQEFTAISNAALEVGDEFGLTTEIVFQVLSDAKAKRAPYEKAAMQHAKNVHTRCFEMQGDELWYVDDLRPFGRIIEKALQIAFANMMIEEVQAKRYITDRKGEKVIAYIPYKTPDFMRKVLDIVLKR